MPAPPAFFLAEIVHNLTLSHRLMPWMLRIFSGLCWHKVKMTIKIVEFFWYNQWEMRSHHRNEQHPRFFLITMSGQPVHSFIGHLTVVDVVVGFTDQRFSAMDSAFQRFGKGSLTQPRTSPMPSTTCMGIF